MYQGRRLERLPRPFLRQLPRRQPAQLLVDQRQQLLGGARVAPLDGGQGGGDVAHGSGRAARRRDWAGV